MDIWFGFSVFPKAVGAFNLKLRRLHHYEDYKFPVKVTVRCFTLAMFTSVKEVFTCKRSKKKKNFFLKLVQGMLFTEKAGGILL